MSNLFAAVSGTFTKPVIVGMLFPALLFLVACWLLVIPMVPWEVTVIATLDKEWKVAGFTIAAILISVLLHVLNNTVIRLFEGYPWKDGPLGVWLTKRHRMALQTQLDLLPDLHKMRKAVKARLTAEKNAIRDNVALTVDEKRDASKKIDDTLGATFEKLEAGQRNIVERRYLQHPQPSAVLPTRLGNVIRSSEEYSLHQYGIAAIPLWPRFLPSIDSGYAAAIDDAKSQLDFALNGSFLFALLFIVIAFLGVLFPVPFVTPGFFFVWLLKLAITAAAALLFYRVAINRAAEWGVLVRGVFDLFRRPVLKALGFSAEPATLREERKLWGEISRQYGYGDRVDLTNDSDILTFAPAAAALPVIAVSPIQLTPDTLSVSRGVSPRVKRVRTIFSRIHNPGTAAVTGTLVETLTGRQYVWGSAKVGARLVVPQGTNPYTFPLGDIPAGGFIDLEYQIEEA